MSGLNNLDPLKAIKAFERAGWKQTRQTGSHVILTQAGNPINISIPVHKGKPVKQELIRHQIKIAGMSVDQFMELYK
ncbi:MAG: type II toxin-antitoxin system HicA family toxin [Syntrophales bacterium]|jgi:predicted RNA binding protein YcfA (HicA-like mRNA interferase family)|nr:type II toxin-antitoxin system HicA family toxin [Syntrophales bacterium]